MNFEHEKSNRQDKAAKANYWELSGDPDYRFIKGAFCEPADPSRSGPRPRFRTKPLSDDFALWPTSKVLNGSTLGRIRDCAFVRRDVYRHFGKFPSGYKLDITDREEYAIACVWQINKIFVMIADYHGISLNDVRIRLPKSNFRYLETGVYLAFGFSSSIVDIGKSVAANRVDVSIYDKLDSFDVLTATSIKILHGYFRIRSFVDQFLQATEEEKKIHRQTKKKNKKG